LVSRGDAVRLSPLVVLAATVVLLTETGPNWAEKVTAIGTAVAAVGIVVAAVGAWLAFNQLRETRRDRHIQVLTEYGRRWDDDRIAEARLEVQRFTSLELADEVVKWLTPPREEHSPMPILLRIPNFFEDLAIMVECGRLQIGLVARSWLPAAVREWEYWSDAVEKMREYEPTAYVEFEKMVRDLLEEQQKKT
jgi:hypothetical protein